MTNDQDVSTAIPTFAIKDSLKDPFNLAILVCLAKSAQPLSVDKLVDILRPLDKKLKLKDPKRSQPIVPNIDKAQRDKNFRGSVVNRLHHALDNLTDKAGESSTGRGLEGITYSINEHGEEYIRYISTTGQHHLTKDDISFLDVINTVSAKMDKMRIKLAKTSLGATLEQSPILTAGKFATLNPSLFNDTGR